MTRDTRSRRSPVTVWLALQAMTLGVPLDVVRNMTWRQWQVAQLVRANGGLQMFSKGGVQ